MNDFLTLSAIMVSVFGVVYFTTHEYLHYAHTKHIQQTKE